MDADQLQLVKNGSDWGDLDRFELLVVTGNVYFYWETLDYGCGYLC